MTLASEHDLPDAQTPTRRHAVPGTYNLRDVGGYRAGDGETRWGKLFRSDALHRLDADSRAELGSLGIRSVVDLREANERNAAPSLLEGLDIRVHHLPVFDGAAPTRLAEERVTLDEVYGRIVDERGANLVRVIRVIARSGDEPVLVHCTAGKDRTGLVIALTLLAVGVHRTEVVADYALTQQHLAGEWLARRRSEVLTDGTEGTPALDQLLGGSPPDALERILDRIDREHGSVEGYLSAHGLGEDDREQLLAVLVRDGGEAR
jgi:protein-tyrosine phosphatase